MGRTRGRGSEDVKEEMVEERDTSKTDINDKSAGSEKRAPSQTKKEPIEKHRYTVENEEQGEEERVMGEEGVGEGEGEEGEGNDASVSAQEHNLSSNSREQLQEVVESPRRPRRAAATRFLENFQSFHQKPKLEFERNLPPKPIVKRGRGRARGSNFHSPRTTARDIVHRHPHHYEMEGGMQMQRGGGRGARVLGPVHGENEEEHVEVLDTSLGLEEMEEFDLNAPYDTQSGSKRTEYPPEIKWFSRRFIHTVPEAAETILCQEEMPSQIYCTGVPDHAPRNALTGTFLIDTETLEEPESVFNDIHGYWGEPLIEHISFHYKTPSLAERVFKTSKLYDHPDTVIVYGYRYSHPNMKRPGGGKLLKHVFCVKDQEEKMKKWAMVSYKWDKIQPTENVPPGVKIVNTAGEVMPEELEENYATEVEDFGPGINVFRDTAVYEFSEASDIILRADQLIQNSSSDIYCERVPTRAPLQMMEATFLIDTRALQSFRAVFIDSHGNWGKPSGVCAYYRVHLPDRSLSRVDADGKLVSPDGAIPEFHYKIHKARYRHPNSRPADGEGGLLKYVFTGRNRTGTTLRWALVSYRWSCIPFKFSAAERRIDLNSVLEGSLRAPNLYKPQKHGVLQRDQYGNVVYRSFTEAEANQRKIAVVMKRKMDAVEMEQRLCVLKGTSWDGVPVEGSMLEEEVYPDGVFPFGYKFINTFLDAVDILLRTDPLEPVCTVQPLQAPMKRREITYVVDLQEVGHNQINFDNHGSWGQSHGSANFFQVTSESIQRMNCLEDEGCNVKVQKLRYAHVNTNRQLLKTVFTCRSGSGKFFRYGIVSYCWLTDPFDFPPGLTKKKERDRERGELSSTISVNRKADTSEIVEDFVGDPTECLDPVIGEKTGKYVNTSGSNPELQAIREFMIKKGAQFVENIETQEAEDRHRDTEEVYAQEYYPDKVAPFCGQCVTSFTDAVNIMVRNTPEGNVCRAVPPFAPQLARTITYVVDLQALSDSRDIFVDQHGTWGKCATEKAFYRYTQYGVERLDTNGKMPEQMQNAYDFRIRKFKYKHSATDDNLKKNIFVANNVQDEYFRWALVSYKWDCRPFDFSSRGMGKRVGSVRESSGNRKIKDLSMVYSNDSESYQIVQEEVTTDGGSLYHPPKDVKHAANFGRFPKSIHKAAEFIFSNNTSAIREFPSKNGFFAVMDETCDPVQTHTVTKKGVGRYTCGCEEFQNCGLCRHSLAVAKLKNEAKKFLDFAASRNFGETSSGQEGEGEREEELTEDTTMESPGPPLMNSTRVTRAKSKRSSSPNFNEMSIEIEEEESTGKRTSKRLKKIDHQYSGK